VAAIGVGHLLVVVAHVGNANSLTGVTAAGETFTVVGGSCQGFNFSTETGCAYAPKSVGGATTVTCNWSGTASASNTTCSVYEMPYTTNCAPNPSISLDGHGVNNNAASSTPAGFNFSNSIAGIVQGYNEVEFQFINVASGTPSAIDSSFVLDNHTGQVADAHLLNTIKANAPTWTNSGSAASVVGGLAFSENLCTPLATFPQATGLRAAYDNNGLDGTQELTITVPGQFKIGFEQADNWGLAQWFDLVNDPSATTNLLQPACPAGSCNAGSLQQAEPGMFNVTYYSFADEKQFQKSSHYFFPVAPRSLNILEHNSSRIVVETQSLPAVTSQDVLNNVTGTARYYIYSNGQIYVHYTCKVTNAVTITAGKFSDITFEDPTQTGTAPPDSQGWIRASATQNPYSSNAGVETYLFAYWGPSTPNPYTNYTKASIMIVHSPTNSQGSQVIHSWGSGTGHGVVRWGWLWPATDTALGAGGSISIDYLIQIGTQGSTLLPNITSSTVAGPIATAYINNPVPPPPTSVSTAVNQGATAQFIANDVGTWTLAGTDNSGAANSGVGGITSGGLYTAPASVTAQQSMGGFQLFPNNHIFNTRIDSLPVNANNTTWLNVVNAGSGQPAPDSVGIPTNYITPTTSSPQTMTFFYTSANNGTYLIPLFPAIMQQGGYFDALSNGNRDHHLFAMDISSGTMEEFYQNYAECNTTAASVNGSNSATLTCTNNPISSGFVSGQSICVGSFTGSDTYFNVCPVTISAVTSTAISYALTHAAASATSNGSATINIGGIGCSVAGTCTSQSGLRYNYYDYPLPTVSTNAAGTFQLPIQLRLQEMKQAVAAGDTIHHVLAMTFGLGFLASSNIWPATQFATDGGTVPFGARFRLKSTFDISSYSAIAKVLLKQLQQYGWMVTDGGNNWPSESETNVWPASYVQAMTDVTNAGISCTITNTQVVANVSTITCPNSFAVNYRVFITGTTNNGGILNNAWYVVTSANSTSFQFSFATNFASATDTGNARSGLANYCEFVDESSLMVSSTSGLTTRNREIVTFTRTADSATTNADVALQGVAVGFPQDYLYIMAGAPAYQIPVLVNIGSVTWSMSPSVGTLTSGGLFTAPATLASATTSIFTATSTVNGTVSAQLSVTVFPNTAIRILPSQTSNYTDSFGNVWWANTGTNLPLVTYCCGCPSIPAVTDHQLWDCEVGNGSAFPIDVEANFIVPNGTYQITYRYGTANASGFLTNTLSVGTSKFFTGDMAQIAGGINKTFSNVTQNVVVTNNQLNFGIWTGGPLASTANVGAPISSVSIIPGSLSTQQGHLP
jgi:hypothetical protein